MWEEECDIICKIGERGSQIGFRVCRKGERASAQDRVEAEFQSAKRGKEWRVREIKWWKLRGATMKDQVQATNQHPKKNERWRKDNKMIR